MYLAVVSCCQQAREKYRSTSIIVALDSVLLLLRIFECARHLDELLTGYGLKRYYSLWLSDVLYASYVTHW